MEAQQCQQIIERVVYSLLGVCVHLLCKDTKQNAKQCKDPQTSVWEIESTPCSRSQYKFCEYTISQSLIFHCPSLRSARTSAGGRRSGSGAASTWPAPCAVCPELLLVPAAPRLPALCHVLLGRLHLVLEPVVLPPEAVAGTLEQHRLGQELRRRQVDLRLGLLDSVRLSPAACAWF